jgi:hypothetical protein
MIKYWCYNNKDEKLGGGVTFGKYTFLFISMKGHPLAVYYYRM